MRTLVEAFIIEALCEGIWYGYDYLKFWIRLWERSYSWARGRFYLGRLQNQFTRFDFIDLVYPLFPFRLFFFHTNDCNDCVSHLGQSLALWPLGLESLGDCHNLRKQMCRSRVLGNCQPASNQQWHTNSSSWIALRFSLKGSGEWLDESRWPWSDRKFPPNFPNFPPNVGS